ncbi:MAG TPA: hypothetical protein VGG19_15455 [Tepidisphaeraceae bacterium]
MKLLRCTGKDYYSQRGGSRDFAQLGRSMVTTTGERTRAYVAWLTLVVGSA